MTSRLLFYPNKPNATCMQTQQKKLKKEERVILLEKLSKSSFSSDLMKSSKKLGQGRETMKEKLRKTLYEKRMGLPLSDPSVPLLVEGDVEYEVSNHDDNDVDVKKTITEKTTLSVNRESNAEGCVSRKEQEATPVVLGSALKRGPDGEFLMQIKKKKRKKKTKRSRKLLQKDNNDSFDSSDSEYDSDKDLKSFKEWAEEQMEVKSEITSVNTKLETTDTGQLNNIVLIRDGIDITGDDFLDLGYDAKPKLVKKAFYVPVKRKPEIQAVRNALPICGEEQSIMEAINENPVVIICGETGSGKTTQVPQFLYEAGYGNPNSDNPGIIGVTQPRRVAAMSMSKRVAQELSLTEQEVSYQIRYDTTVSEKTVIKFMTDGVLLRELAGDFLLSKYSAIIIDEAHERSLNTDILIGVVSRVLRLRAELSEEQQGKIRPLKIIIMSATLRVSDFTENKSLFKIPPLLISVDARQHPVSIHFNKRTPKADHVTEAFRKVCKIHMRLPHGGILVFLTGQNEISTLCKKLRKKFPDHPLTKRNYRCEEVQSINDEPGKSRKNSTSNKGLSDYVEAEELLIDDNVDEPDTSETDSDSTDEGFENDDSEIAMPLHILPLYSLLPTQAQMRVFEPPPEGSRLCVIATNVAETSLTIPGIKYVVDCGKVKERHYDPTTNVQSFAIGWTSKASADQRAGRAGRTSPGHCYRLYSSAVFNDKFEQFTFPEIYRTPIEGVVLQMKAMNIDTVANFPFPTPPDREKLRKAEKLLLHLGALDENGHITDLGRTMATFPISPRFSKMLIIGSQHGCLPYIIAVVSALSIGDPFIKEYHLDDKTDDENSEDEESETSRLRKQELGEISKGDAEKERRRQMKKEFYKVLQRHAGLDPTSDILKLLNVVGAYEYAGGTESFCQSNFVRSKAMREIYKLRGQITDIVQTNCPDVDVCVDPKMRPPSAVQLKAIRQIITAGFIDQVAVRKGFVEKAAVSHKSTRGVAYTTMWSEEDVFIHPSSVLFHGKPPDFLVYEELQQTTKVWMKGITVIEPTWLSKIGKSLCTYSKPADSRITKTSLAKKQNAEMTALVIPSFGPKSWELPPIKVVAKLVNGRWVYENA